MIDNPTGKKLPRRLIPPRAIVVHGTGATDIDKVIGYYTNGQISDMACSHFVIDHGGNVHKIADPATQEAWHCAMHPREAAIYSQGFDVWSRYTSEGHIPVPLKPPDGRYDWWRTKWGPRGYNSPLRLITSERPNFYSVGVELLSCDHPTARGFEDVQYEALGILLHSLCTQFHIPRDDGHILSHSEVNPLARTYDAKHGLNFDPGRNFDWPGLFSFMQGLTK